jgi:xanthine dehydrogenase YagR molybdenum-binding subunit
VARAFPDGRYGVGIGATDIGTGARTVLGQIAADALGVDPDVVDVAVGDSALPDGPVAGDSAGTASWGSAVVKACEALVDQLTALGGGTPDHEVVALGDTAEDVERDGDDVSRHAFGAHFAEVHVDVDTGEVRVPRMLGVYGVGRVMNARLARSQFVGGMTMGMGMALHEVSTMDEAFGDFLNHDLAQYHVPVSADVQEIDAFWVDEDDPHLNPMGAKGIGEIGIVGSPAAIGNAVFHATGVRFRELPLTPDRVLRGLQG